MSGAPVEPHMRVYRDRVVLIRADGRELTFAQGPMSAGAQTRYESIRQALEGGWLDTTAALALNSAFTTSLTPDWQTRLERLADGVTNQEGKALATISVLQAAIKAIEPAQSIRLTKGHAGPKATKAPKRKTVDAPKRRETFSWADGLSMRTLSSEYLVPFLRKQNLVLMNADGPFMTRGFAENYPYSPFYKAEIRGPRPDWDDLVEGLESGDLNAKDAFVYLIALLSNRSKAFETSVKETMRAVRAYLGTNRTFSEIATLIDEHVRDSRNAARPLEIAIHSLYQAIYWKRPGAMLELRPLAQMRSANVKAGNVGDVELVRAVDRAPVVAWDAKFGIVDLSEQIGELGGKLLSNRTVERAGFVVDSTPRSDPLTVRLLSESGQKTGAAVTVQKFREWAEAEARMTGLVLDEIGRNWLTAYAETLCQMRREIAPIDEPSKPWVDGLREKLDEIMA